MNSGLNAYKKKFYITKSANEWIFAGYQDPFVTLGGIASKFTKDVEVPYDRIGWLYTVSFIYFIAHNNSNGNLFLQFHYL